MTINQFWPVLAATRDRSPRKSPKATAAQGLAVMSSSKRPEMGIFERARFATYETNRLKQKGNTKCQR